MKKVYIVMSADIIHYGHINIISKAAEYGELTVGILTDKAISEYKRMPIMTYDERAKIIENIRGVSHVIKQEKLDYEENLRLLKPDYVFHGTDWREGIQSDIRKKVIEVLDEFGGKLIEVPYTEGISISKMEQILKNKGVTPDIRRCSLKKLLSVKQSIRIMEAHNGLTGLIVENAVVQKDGKIKKFDGIWISSLCDSTIKGKPDIELVDLTSRISTINEILEVTTKPIILDGDTGGITEHFVYTVKTIERLGISAIIIEDKKGLKKNSLFGTDVEQTQETIDDFCYKINQGKKSQITDEFMIIARIESLILKKGMKDAFMRAKSYINAGADGIMIHSREKSGDEIRKFCALYKSLKTDIPLILVPTSYNHIKEEEFQEMGANIIIYANHLIRSAYPAMQKTACDILEHGRSFECDKNIMDIKDILELIPGGQ